MRQKQRTGYGGLIKRVVFSLAAFVFVLSLLDFISWLFIRSAFEKASLESDKFLVFRLRPDEKVEYCFGQFYKQWWKKGALKETLTTNADGFRGEAVPPKKAGELRIVCLGDSSTMGYGVGDSWTYPFLLESELRGKYPNTTINVINAAVMGYSSRQGVYSLKSKFLNYKPDVVIWAFGFNDQSVYPFVDNIDLKYVPFEPGEEMADPFITNRMFFWAYRRPLAQLVHSYIFPIIWRAKIAKMIPLIEKEGKFPPRRKKTNLYEKARVPPDHFILNLAEVHALSKKNNFKLIVLNLWGVSDEYGNAAQRYCNNNDIPFIDISKKFGEIIIMDPGERPRAFQKTFDHYYKDQIKPEALEKSPMLLLTMDGLHPNNLGNLIISRVLASYISDNMRR